MAGGTGARMKSEVPKQFLLIDGEPIIVRTVRQFLEVTESSKIIVVLPENHMTHWHNLLNDFPFLAQVQVAMGGETRTQSVLAGLEKIKGDGLVAIHDAVRPFVTAEIINNSYESAELHGSGVTVVDLKDSIRERVGQKNQTRDRADFVLVQTPQTFRVGELKNAYAKLKKDELHTDDASVYERAGYEVFLIEGSYSNIKITTPEDLK